MCSRRRRRTSCLSFSVRIEYRERQTLILFLSLRPRLGPSGGRVVGWSVAIVARLLLSLVVVMVRAVALCIAARAVVATMDGLAGGDRGGNPGGATSMLFHAAAGGTTGSSRAWRTRLAEANTLACTWGAWACAAACVLRSHTSAASQPSLHPTPTPTHPSTHAGTTATRPSRQRFNCYHPTLGYFWGPMPFMIWLATIVVAIEGDWDDFGVLMTLQMVNGVVGYFEEKSAVG